jgi:N-formylglutamate amidohydrolase
MLGVHSIQVEINRRLYLDEMAVEKTPGFAALASNLGSLTRRLVEAALHQ